MRLAAPWLALASEVVLFLEEKEPMCISEAVERDQLLEVRSAKRMLILQILVIIFLRKKEGQSLR